MDFIEKLPMSDGSDTILVIIDCLTQQSIFIPTVSTIMSPMLAKLFVLHVFSKHGVPSHVTSDHGMEFISAFFCSLSKVLDMKFHFTMYPLKMIPLSAHCMILSSYTLRSLSISLSHQATFLLFNKLSWVAQNISNSFTKSPHATNGLLSCTTTLCFITAG